MKIKPIPQSIPNVEILLHNPSYGCFTPIPPKGGKEMSWISNPPASMQAGMSSEIA